MDATPLPISGCHFHSYLNMYIQPAALTELIKQDYLTYAMHTLKHRSLPNIVDGLKPVHRRILWAMHEQNYTRFVKCSRVTGEVMGKYHPHGSSYPALVTLAQEFNRRYPLIDGYGNFGTLDDAPAAERYTECRLSSLTASVFFKDKPFEMRQNYDASRMEPVTLSPVLPALLLNPTMGVAVGWGCQHAPYNGVELCDLVVRFLKGKRIKPIYPDFPSGGLMQNTEELANVFRRGEGTLVLRSRVERDGNLLVFTELPYGCSAERLIEDIKRMAPDCEDIRGVSNETDRDGERVIVEVRKGTDPTNDIFRSTCAQSNFGVRATCLHDDSIQNFGVMDVVKAWWEHRSSCINIRLEEQKAKLKSNIVDFEMRQHACKNRKFIAAQLAKPLPPKELEKALGEFAWCAQLRIIELADEAYWSGKIDDAREQLLRLESTTAEQVAIADIDSVRSVFDERRTQVADFELPKAEKKEPRGCLLEIKDGKVRVRTGKTAKFFTHTFDQFLYGVSSDGRYYRTRLRKVGPKFTSPSFVLKAPGIVKAFLPPESGYVVVLTGKGNLLRYEWKNVKNRSKACALRNDFVRDILFTDKDNVLLEDASGKKTLYTVPLCKNLAVGFKTKKQWVRMHL